MQPHTTSWISITHRMLSDKPDREEYILRIPLISTLEVGQLNLCC